MSQLRNQIRIEQTSNELERLQREMEEWFNKRRHKDKRRQYYSQLNMLETVLISALSGLRASLDSLASEQSVGEIYGTCGQFDRRLVWLRRVWRYFGDKFDQRDDPQLGPALAAADEIVWSCYAGIFRKAKVARGTAPLPYIEPLYSPQAIPRDDPSGLRDRSVGHHFLKEYLSQLPIPVVSLPPVCVVAPWWLIFLGHEVGHHVQYDLQPNLQLVGSFGDCLQAVAEANLPADDHKTAKKWKRWGREVFADAFSITNMGVWALRGMTELEMGHEASMLGEKGLYPAPVVRLSLMAQLASALSLNGERGLHGLHPAQLTSDAQYIESLKKRGTMAERNLAIVPAIVTAIRQYQFNDLGHFERLCNWPASNLVARKHIKPVSRWSKALRGNAPLRAKQSLSAARLIISGGVAAWAEISEISDAQQRVEAQAKLGENLLKIIPKSREEGTRSAESEPKAEDASVLGHDLSQLLLQASPEELGL